jgi:hypothetical protein
MPTGVDVALDTEQQSCRTTGPLSLCLKTDRRSYYPGEPVQITLEITAMERVSGWYSSSCSSDFGVESQWGKEVWRLLAGMACLDIVLPLELGAGETLTHTVTWDQQDNSNMQVPPGDYLAWGQGMFCLNPPWQFCRPKSALVPITIAASAVASDGAVGGIAEYPQLKPDAARSTRGSLAPDAIALAGLAAGAALLLTAGSCYARKRRRAG